MKDIPIVILNKDRLNPLKSLVDCLRTRGYENILIIDNKSTYEPLLDWYKSSKLNVFHNNIAVTNFDNETFHKLAIIHKIPPFSDIVSDYYVFTDSDVVPNENIPNDFIQHMKEIYDEFSGKNVVMHETRHGGRLWMSSQIDKVGLALKIDDLPESDFKAQILEWETPYWYDLVPHENENYKLYIAAIDTTFALHGPHKHPRISINTLRMGGDYIGLHAPWYYDTHNLPEDEAYYVRNLERNKGPVYTARIKDILTNGQFLQR